MLPKRVASLILLVCGVMVISGCLPSVPLNERAIVQAVGVDYDMSSYLITLQIYAPVSDDGGGDQNQYTVVKERGDTLTEAFDRAGEKMGKRIFMGNSWVLIMGRDTAEKGIPYILDFFLQNQQVHATLMLAMAQGRAEEMFPSDQAVSPAYFIEHAIESAEKDGGIPRSRAMDMATAVEGENRDTAIPVLTMTTTASGTQQPVLSGLAALKNSRLVGDLDLEQSKAIQWCTGNISRVPVMVDVPDIARVAVIMNGSKSRVETRIEDGVPAYDITIQAQGEITEMINSRKIGLDEEGLDQIEKLVSEKISQQVQSLVRTAIYNYNCDVLRLEDHLKKYEYAYWDEHPDGGMEMMPEMKITLKVESSLRRSNGTWVSPRK